MLKRSRSHLVGDGSESDYLRWKSPYSGMELAKGLLPKRGRQLVAVVLCDSARLSDNEDLPFEMYFAGVSVRRAEGITEAF
jgi:hypothetical protein